MVDSSNTSSSRIGISLIFVLFIIIAAALAWAWRANFLAHLLPDGVKARYGLVADDPLK